MQTVTSAGHKLQEGIGILVLVTTTVLVPRAQLQESLKLVRIPT